MTALALVMALLACSSGDEDEAPVAAAGESAEAAAGESAEATAGGEATAAGETLTTDSGLQITHLTAGDGASPTAASRVVVHYHGTFPDGRVFDSSVDRGQPATFPLRRVVRCWTEGVQLMKVGGKADLVCPPNIAYGARGMPGRIPPNATLHFQVELLEIK